MKIERGNFNKDSTEEYKSISPQIHLVYPSWIFGEGAQYPCWE